MERGPDKPELQVKLARCRVLLRDYPDGPTAEYIREPESELRDQLPALEEQYPDPPPTRQENAQSGGTRLADLALGITQAREMLADVNQITLDTPLQV
jgi:hypothetical protein